MDKFSDKAKFKKMMGMRTDKEFGRMVQSEVGFTMWICGFNHFDRAELRQAMPTMIILQMKSPTQ